MALLRAGLWGVFGLMLFPAFAIAEGGVSISEIAWMGTTNSANDEWIELVNTSASSVSLEGWTLSAEDGSPKIILSGTIAGSGYFLLERTQDGVVAGVPADGIYTGALSNSGEVLVLRDANGSEVDRVSALEGWPAGDNTTKDTMQRVDGAWVTGAGTPKAQNKGSAAVITTTPNTTTTQDTKNNSAVGGGTTPYTAPEYVPKFGATIQGPNNVSTYARSTFIASAVGHSGEALGGERVRYFWNFGDGTTKDGMRVEKAYQFAGTYTIRLTVISGDEQIATEHAVRVSDHAVALSEVSAGDSSWIEVVNNAQSPAEVSGWVITSGDAHFQFPDGSILGAGSGVVLAQEVLGMHILADNVRVELHDGQGHKIDEFVTPRIPSGATFARVGALLTLARPTPGATNVALISSLARPLASTQKTAASSGASAGTSSNQNAPSAVPASAVSEDISDDATARTQEGANVSGVAMSPFIKNILWLLGSVMVGLGMGWLVRYIVKQRAS